MFQQQQEQSHNDENHSFFSPSQELSSFDSVSTNFYLDDEYRLAYPFCPCTSSRGRKRSRGFFFNRQEQLHGEETRWLSDNTDNDDDGNVPWEIAYTAIVLFGMFAALVSDRVGADSVMTAALTLLLAAQIISIDEALKGFANAGLWTVMVLFVVAEGINKTGAVDWYMSKLLGRPQTLAGAQLKLMAPVAFLSAFLNNTPIVVVMIPIVQKWAKNIAQSPRQLLIPLSFASILGGTCTLIGTSTNLVVVGLLDDRYGNDPNVNINIGLFDLGLYGVPVALAGMAYVLVASPFWLPGGKAGAVADADMADEVLLGARLTPWSPAVNRTVQRSGLRDTGGIYLVSVRRAATGNVHRAVSKDFVLGVGDILYFTTAGQATALDTFGEFCAEHGLEVLTNETNVDEQHLGSSPKKAFAQPGDDKDEDVGGGATVETEVTEDVIMHEPRDMSSRRFVDEDEATMTLDTTQGIDTVAESTAVPLLLKPMSAKLADLDPIAEDGTDKIPLGRNLGCTKESLLQADHAELTRNINYMTDLVRNAHTLNPDRRSILPPDLTQTRTASGIIKVQKATKSNLQKRISVDGLRGSDPPKIVVTVDKDGLVVVGINARDRAGLLLDISRGLLRLDLQLHHTEAAVLIDRSVSIWRCQAIGIDLPDAEEIWSVLSALLSADVGVEAMKKRGLRVVRAKVMPNSRLVGQAAKDVNFRQVYKTAIVALQHADGTNATTNLSSVPLQAGDILILQASDDSPLLRPPPKTFYKDLQEETKRLQKELDGISSRSSSVQSLVNLLRRRPSEDKLSAAPAVAEDDISSAEGASGKGCSKSDDSHKEPAEPEEHGREGNVAVFGWEHLEAEVPGNQDDVVLEDQEATKDESLDTAVYRQSQQDKVWRDLMVLFHENTGNGQQGAGAGREFLTAMTVAPKSNLAGKTVAQAGIHKLPGLHLVSMERPKHSDSGGENEQDVVGDDTNHPQAQIRHSPKAIWENIVSASLWAYHRQQVRQEENEEATREGDAKSVRTEQVAFEAIDPDTPLEAGDVLWFSGSASAVGDLRKIPGLVQCQSEQVDQINERVHDRRLVQAVIARNGPLVGKTVKEVQFRTRYGAAVIAVHREGRRVHEHPGRIKLQAGDVLLLEAGPSFIRKSAENDRAFALLAEVKNSAPPRLALLIPALVIAVAMLVVYTAGVTDLLTCALVASVFMVVSGILSEQEVRDALKWDIYVTIAGAFGIGTALVNSGVAGGIANFLVNIGEAVGIGDAGLLGSVYFATFLISNVVTNNAAAALLFPVAMDAAEQTGVDLVIMGYAVMLGASASFMSPFGYTTNLLIYGPGGYKTMDFVRFGTPMQIVLWILTTAFLVIEQWYISWILTSALLFVAAFFCLGRSTATAAW